MNDFRKFENRDRSELAIAEKKREDKLSSRKVEEQKLVNQALIIIIMEAKI